jgi:hypothetical protein
MGYFAYNIYLIEFEKMLKSSSDVKKEINIIDGIYDYYTYEEMVFNTIDETKESYLDINPSINQEGGAEYSYNFWLYTDKTNLPYTNPNKDIVLFFKGEKTLYYSNTNYNCSTINASSKNNVNVLIKNPLVKLKDDGSAIVLEFNNIYNPDSYQHGSKYINCDNVNSEWNERNKNLLGVYDLNFNKKWFMVTIVMREVADANNILMKNRASCKIYINGINVLDKKAETLYTSQSFSATLKNNKSPFYMNPNFAKSYNGGVIKDDMQRYVKKTDLQENELKLADLKYFNYALPDTKILELYGNGFSKKAAKKNIAENEVKFYQVSSAEMQLQEIKEI